MSVQSILNAVGQLGREAMDLPVGDPRLNDLRSRIDALAGELDREKGLHTPLVPDSARPTSTEDATVQELEHALGSLRSAVISKQSSTASETTPPDVDVVSKR
jgi:hypothetical protein